jgi:LPS O-antigen subunit length determinant protein (WzzB/FepE family)
VLVFVITLDVLKYGFHIDPAEDIQRRKWRKGIQKKQKKPPPVIKRFKYVNKPSAPPESSVDIVNETAV